MKNKGLHLKYFVLKPGVCFDIYEHASCEAILKYAEIIEKENSELANDLRKWIDEAKEISVEV